ncbi:MAG: hypothetical protein ACXADB_06140 [Candidatus Hermodarchaeia archaeon]|jgi:hypothetical protein
MFDASLHIYSQWQWHDSAHIVGDEEALKRLRDAIDNALEWGSDYTEAMTSDGEGFRVIIVKGDVDELTLPYQDEIAKGQTCHREGGAPGKTEPWELESVQKVEQRAQEEYEKKDDE